MSDVETPAVPTDGDIFEPRLWKKNGWTAKVIKNDGDDGWAVEMTRTGDPEPALVGPWVMGRDKKNPKPLNVADFTTLVKTASEVIRRHEQAMAPKKISHNGVDERGDRWRVDCVDIHDEDEPHALLTSRDPGGSVVFEKKVRLGFKINAAKAEQFAKTGEV